jgi:hypothetical protein
MRAYFLNVISNGNDHGTVSALGVLLKRQGSVSTFVRYAYTTEMQRADIIRKA